MANSFTVLTSKQETEFSALISIYQDAIEPTEQKTPKEIEAMLNDRRYVLTVSYTGSQISGFTIAFFPDGANFWLLEYMAVVAEMRGKRIGEALFNEAYRYGQQRDPERICLLEVDRPCSSTNPKNDTEGRFRFYRRLDCRAVQGLDYILPLDAGGTPPPMLLLTYRQPPLETVSKVRVRQWLMSLYVDVYGKLPSDARIDMMVSHLGEIIRLVRI